MLGSTWLHVIWQIIMQFTKLLNTVFIISRLTFTNYWFWTSEQKYIKPWRLWVCNVIAVFMFVLHPWTFCCVFHPPMCSVWTSFLSVSDDCQLVQLCVVNYLQFPVYLVQPVLCSLVWSTWSLHVLIKDYLHLSLPYLHVYLIVVSQFVHIMQEWVMQIIVFALNIVIAAVNK